MNVVLWSRRFDGEQRPLTEQEARELGVEAARRVRSRSSSRRRPATWPRARDILSVHLALGPGHEGPGECARCSAG